MTELDELPETGTGEIPVGCRDAWSPRRSAPAC